MTLILAFIFSAHLIIDFCSHVNISVLVTLNICYAMLLGQERYVVLFVTVSSVVLFYCAHWSTYCTGRLKFAKQVLLCILYVIYY